VQVASSGHAVHAAMQAAWNRAAFTWKQFLCMPGAFRSCQLALWGPELAALPAWAGCTSI